MKHERCEIDFGWRDYSCEHFRLGLIPCRPGLFGGRARSRQGRECQPNYSLVHFFLTRIQFIN